jgi:hypothetical protein
MGLKEWIIPQDQVFFDMLESQSKIVAEASTLFSELFEDFSTLEEKRKKIKNLEHSCDQLVHDIHYKLNETLVTPIDHEDIANLASFYDDVLDYIFATTNKLYLYNITEAPAAMKQFASIIKQQVVYLNKAMANIKELKKAEIEKNCIEVHNLESAADDLLDTEIANLFRQRDPIKIMKLKDIYEYLETITDKCDNVGNVLLDIRMKYG